MWLVLALLLSQGLPPQPRDAAATVSVRGRVLDGVSNDPVAGALITVWSTTPGVAAVHVEAAPDGSFELRNLPPSARLSVGPPPMQATHVPRVLLLDRVIDKREVIVHLDRALAVDGRLLDEHDEPMANVRVVAEPFEGATAAVPREHFSDGQGVFRVFGLAPGRYRLCAVPERRAGLTTYVKTCLPDDGSAVELRHGSSVPDVTIQVRRVNPTTRHPAASAEDPVAIRGRILDEPTMAPVPRALVSLTSPAGRESFEAVADERGHFDLRVSPGLYDLQAAAGALKSTHVPSRPREILLMSGDTFQEFAIALARSAAPRGEVTNGPGVPLADVLIEFVPLPGTTPLALEYPPITDDRGRFSAHGIPPGRYTVCASPSPPTHRAEENGEWAYGRACAPFATMLRAGDARLLPIRLERLGAYTIAGRVIGPAGEVASSVIAELTRVSDGRKRTTTLPLERDGSFLVAGLVPGTYELTARAYTPTDPRLRTRELGRWGFHRVEIVDADVGGVVLQVSEGITLRGRVTIDDHTSDRSLAGIEVRAVAATGSRAPSAPAVETDADGAFSLPGVFGESVLRVRTPLGYDITAIRYAGRDITDVAVEFSADPSLGAEIVLSPANVELSGRVLDDDGTPVEDAGVLYFPADPSRWKAYEGGLRQQSVGGRYRIDKIPAGDYLVIAVSGPRPGWTEKDYAALAPLAERVTLAGGERRALDLRVVTLGR